ncbi:MAG: hypothetical protein PHV34_16310 [Verrucomicrobiae bacterium]|nr:hypothetical protein [Verrucomicrobiae bacterium]
MVINAIATPWAAISSDTIRDPAGHPFFAISQSRQSFPHKELPQNNLNNSAGSFARWLCSSRLASQANFLQQNVNFLRRP